MTSPLHGAVFAGRWRSAVPALVIASIVVTTPAGPNADMYLVVRAARSIANSGFRRCSVYSVRETPEVARDERLVRRGDDLYTIYPKAFEYSLGLWAWLIVYCPWLLLGMTVACAAWFWRKRSVVKMRFTMGFAIVGFLAVAFHHRIQTEPDAFAGVALCLLHSAVGILSVSLFTSVLDSIDPGIDPSQRNYWIVAVTLGGFFLYYTKCYHREIYSVALILAMILYLVRGRTLVAMVVFAALVVTKPSWMILSPAVAAFGIQGEFMRGSRITVRLLARKILWPFIAVVAGFVFNCGVNWLVTSDAFLEMRFANSLAYNFGESIPGFVLSPAKSFFLFFPPALLCIGWTRKYWFGTPVRSLLTLCAAITVVFHASLTWWHGAWSWGPRYLLPCTFFLAALAMNNARSGPGWLAASVLIAGVVLNAPATLLDADNWLYYELARGKTLDDLNLTIVPMRIEYELVLDRLLHRNFRWTRDNSLWTSLLRS